jgi:hypothetical protein
MKRFREAEGDALRRTHLPPRDEEHALSLCEKYLPDSGKHLRKEV